MNQAANTPILFWIIAIVGLLWNAMGAFDYIMTQTQNENYMANFTEAQLEYFYGFPSWMVAAWAVGVWGSFFGSLAMVMRKAWAVWLFGASLLGLLVSSLYNFVFSNGLEVMGQSGAIFTAVIWGVILFLLFYCRAMSAKGVLK